MNTYPSARAISNRVLDHPIDGCGLTGSTLREELGNGVQLLSFLRHFG